MIAVLTAVYMALSTPLPGRIVYACAGNSDMLRSQWAVWEAVAGRRCQAFLDNLAARQHSRSPRCSLSSQRPLPVAEAVPVPAASAQPDNGAPNASLPVLPCSCVVVPAVSLTRHTAPPQ